MPELTFGFETEFFSASRFMEAEIPELPRGYMMTSDGSVRNSRPVGQEKIECGGEIVSPPIPLSELNSTARIFEILAEMQEIPTACASTHIHVGVEASFSNYMRLFKAAQKWEGIFYDYSVPPEQSNHRGVYNDFIYCRPLISPQFAFVAGKDEIISSSYGQVSEAKSIKEFWYALGNFETKGNKWYPPRYVGINFCSLYDHGTLEFRVFNYTGDFNVFRAWVNLCAGFTQSFGEGSPKDWVNERDYRILENLRREIYSKINLSPTLTHLSTSIRWKDGHPLNPEFFPAAYAHRVAEPHPKAKLCSGKIIYTKII